MRVLTATSSTQGDRGDDHCHTVEGELVSLPVLECACPDCGCERGFAGLDSHRATTTCAVAELDIDPMGLRRAVARSLAAQGWIAPLGAEAGADGWGVALAATDDEVIDDVLARMRAVAEAFPLGTVLGRVDGGVVVRRPPPT